MNMAGWIPIRDKLNFIARFKVEVENDSIFIALNAPHQRNEILFANPEFYHLVPTISLSH